MTRIRRDSETILVFLVNVCETVQFLKVIYAMKVRRLRLRS